MTNVLRFFKDWFLQENESWLSLDKKVNFSYTYELVSVGILPKSPDIRRSFGHFLKEKLYFRKLLPLSYDILIIYQCFP